MSEQQEKIEKKENSMVAINPQEAETKGLIQVWNNVVASIVKKYVLEAEGVIRLAPQSLLDGLADILSRRSYDRSIVLEMTDENTIVITLAVVLKFGVSIPDVTRKIQDMILDKVPELTGCLVDKVNVNVVDLEDERPPEEENADAAIPVIPNCGSTLCH